MAETDPVLAVNKPTLDEIISQVIEPMARELALLCEHHRLPFLIAYQSDDITICSWRYIPERVDNRLQVAAMACRSEEVESLIKELAHQIQLALQRH